MDLDVALSINDTGLKVVFAGRISNSNNSGMQMKVAEMMGKRAKSVMASVEEARRILKANEKRRKCKL